MSSEMKPYCHFGVSPGITDFLLFMNEHTIIYPSGTNLVLLNIEASTQQFMYNVQKSRGFTTLAICEPGKVVAAAEKSDGEKPFISIFEMESLKRKKTLQTNLMQSDRFESLSFSSDGKYLGAIGGAPDYLLTIWIWDSKAQALARMRVGPPGQPGIQPSLPDSMIKPHYMISFSTFDNQRFFVYGKETLRQYYIQSSNLFPHKHMRNEGQSACKATCLAWVTEDSMLIGLDCNIVQYYEGVEVRQEFKVIIPSDTDFMLVSSDDPDEFAVRCLVVHDKGFVCSCGRGKIHLYEKSDDGNEKYRKVRVLETKHQPTKGDFGGYIQDPYIISMALSPSQKILMCLAERGLIFSCDMLKDYRKDTKYPLTQIGSKVHTKGVTCVDVCVRKPLIITCSLDKNICLWNYITCRQELYKEFTECIYSVSLHPDGLYLIAGLEKSLKLMNIFIDELVPLKTYPIKNCRCCRFANGGHHFAVANWNVIEIYSSITLNVVYHLRGHADRVNALFWSRSDSRMVTVTDGGEMFEWDVLASRKLSESVTKNCRYYDTYIEGKSIFAVGSDFMVKEIQDSAITKKLSSSTQITRLVITNTSRRIYLGLWTGSIRYLHYPITSLEDGVEQQGHTAPITGLRITFDDQFLVSVSEDGLVIVWMIMDNDLISKSKMESTFSKEVLANPMNLDNMNKVLNELEYKVEQLMAENQLQLHTRDVQYNDNLNKVSVKLKTELENLKQKNQEMTAENTDHQVKYSQHLLELIRNLKGECSLTEQRIKEKLRVESEKYQSLKEQGTRTQEDCERELEEKEKTLQSIVFMLFSTIGSINNNPPEPPPNPMLGWEGVITDLEEDTDMELVTRRENFKELFVRENQAIGEIKMDIISLRKQMNFLSHATKSQKKLIFSKQSITNGLSAEIHSYEQNIHQLRKVLQEKTDALENRVKVEEDLKIKNQSLEKAKYVLDLKIHSLQKQMEPMTSEIKYLKLQALSKEQEFNEFKKNVNVQRAQIFRGKEKLQAIQDVEYLEKGEVTEARKRLNRLVNDLKSCSSVQSKQRTLKKCAFNVYRRNLLKSEQNETTPDNHLHSMNSQRDQLETLIGDLRGQMRRNRVKYENDDKIIMKQNVLLMREINELRKELKEIQGITGLITEAIELDRANPKMSTRDFLDMLVDVTSSAKLVRKVEELKQTLEKRMKAIRFLQHHNLQLKTLIQERQQYIHFGDDDDDDERTPFPQMSGDQRFQSSVQSRMMASRIHQSKIKRKKTKILLNKDAKKR